MTEAEARATPVLAVLLSGGGRTLANLIGCSQSGELPARIGVVVSSVADAGGLEIARQAGIAAATVIRKDFDSDLAYSHAIFSAIAPYDPVLVILAGFLRKIVVPPEWEGRILNIHPALLPEMALASGRGFYGDRVHRAVLDSGQRVSGATVHLVDNGYDTGPVYLRQTVPVEPGDTVESLAARVFAAECELYPRAIAAYLKESGVEK
ncbi:MAG TPA: phosphoribosylglycinamide formyltransferase [Thermomicrobiales bacterium]|nr:phosphoribosylglycinamide formyltransferase [Thermomicrobiales bacterium]